MADHRNPNSNEIDLPHYAKKLLARLEAGRRLCRTSADTEEATGKGGGYLYFTAPDNKRASPASSKMLIERGFVRPVGDGLFAEVSQTFEVVRHG